MSEESSKQNKNDGTSIEATDNLDLESADIDAGFELIPAETVDFDFENALNQLNAERESLFLEADDEAPASEAALIITDKELVKFAKEHGIAELLLLFKKTMTRLGYTITASAEFVHIKSGIIIRL